MEQLSVIKFQASIRLNNEIIKFTTSNPCDARSNLISRAFQKSQEQESKIIIVAKPTIQEDCVEDDDKAEKPPELALTSTKLPKNNKVMSKRDLIAFYRKKALSKLLFLWITD